MLDHFGVTEPTCGTPFGRIRISRPETPRFIGRAVAALAADPNVSRYAWQTLSSWTLAKVYAFTDVDGQRPDWGAYYAALDRADETPEEPVK